MDGGSRDRAPVMVTPVVGTGGAAWKGGADSGNSEMAGADAGSPYWKDGCPEDKGRRSTAARRKEMSPIWRCIA